MLNFARIYQSVPLTNRGHSLSLFLSLSQGNSFSSPLLLFFFSLLSSLLARSTPLALRFRLRLRPRSTSTASCPEVSCTLSTPLPDSCTLFTLFTFIIFNFSSASLSFLTLCTFFPFTRCYFFPRPRESSLTFALLLFPLSLSLSLSLSLLISPVLFGGNFTFASCANSQLLVSPPIQVAACCSCDSQSNTHAFLHAHFIFLVLQLQRHWVAMTTRSHSTRQ